MGEVRRERIKRLEADRIGGERKDRIGVGRDRIGRGWERGWDRERLGEGEVGKEKMREGRKFRSGRESRSERMGECWRARIGEKVSRKRLRREVRKKRGWGERDCEV